MIPSKRLEAEIMLAVRGLEVVRLGLGRSDWAEHLVNDLSSLAFAVDDALRLAEAECGKEAVESGNGRCD